jgi:hypothetical protein
MKAVMRTASVGVWTRSVNGDLGSLTTSEYFEFRVLMKILSRDLMGLPIDSVSVAFLSILFTFLRFKVMCSLLFSPASSPSSSVFVPVDEPASAATP